LVVIVAAAVEEAGDLRSGAELAGHRAYAAEEVAVMAAVDTASQDGSGADCAGIVGSLRVHHVSTAKGVAE
jgi:hypothetical protein